MIKSTSEKMKSIPTTKETPRKCIPYNINLYGYNFKLFIINI